MSIYPHPHRTLALGVLLAAFTTLAGCKKPYDGISDYDRLQMQQQQGADVIVAQGGKAERKNYGLGDAWAIHLPGKEITSDTMSALKSVDKIAELHLGKSTVTDAQIQSLYDQKLLNMMVALDVSHTGVTDAVLDSLSQVQFLSHFDVTGSKITPAGLERFKEARKNHPNAINMRPTKIIGP